MRLRILYTNGVKTIDLFWLIHDGADVYCGAPEFSEKRSYHASGKVHSDNNDNRNHEGWHMPIKDFKKQFHLRTIALNTVNFFDGEFLPKFNFTGKKSDCIVTIDIRSFDPGEPANILIGLLEPNRFDFINNLNSSEKIKQIFLCTDCNPWIYVITCIPNFDF